MGEHITCGFALSMTGIQMGLIVDTLSKLVIGLNAFGPAHWAQLMGGSYQSPPDQEFLAQKEYCDGRGIEA